MVNVVKWDVFQEMDDLRRQVFGDSHVMTNLSVTQATTDVYIEDNDRLIVEVQLAGFGEGDVDVSINEGTLEIHAEKKQKEEFKKTRKYVMQESFSSFHRNIVLPKNINTNKVDSHMENGLLRIVVPFRTLPKPKKISIKTKDKAKK